MTKPSFRNIHASDIPRLQSLWTDCFHEKAKATELFFKRNLFDAHGYTAVVENQIVSAVYLVNCRLCGKNAHYLCGAATLPEYRGLGIMSALIEYALNDARRRGDVYSVLYPADDGLYGFYARLGYEPKCTASRITLDRAELEADAVLADAEKNSGARVPNFQALQRMCFHDKFLLWNHNFIAFAKAYYAVYGVRSAFSENAFVIFEEEREQALVYYSVYRDIQDFKSLLLQNTKAQHFVITGKNGNPLFENSVKEKCGMIKLLDQNEKIPEDTYIGITLN